MMKIKFFRKKDTKVDERYSRFEEVYNDDAFRGCRIIRDKETGVNYLHVLYTEANGGGLTVLVDKNGKPIVT